jgi:hypothetical protein
MQPVNPRSFIAAKEISASVLQSPNVYRAYAIQFRLVHH